MSSTYPFLCSYHCPPFLQSCHAYKQYLIKAEAKEIKLPPYTISSAGKTKGCVPWPSQWTQIYEDAAIQWYGSLPQAEENDGEEYNAGDYAEDDTDEIGN
ncbi:uncharacterized protein N7479_007123 [Penicillium vulpinum]|uniref:uncharacterized protein n=1 Tax=Penicillium vulpinum TaxID=29845 RepID=UPI0025472EDB|nr:uncharacterized protein N7479_007123 [Penicillium vulpinum]KAJ5959973.1 hypothetical protein N7479_007123 [Penicillium vulpinum]